MTTPSTALEITPVLLAEVESTALAALPEECCGILVGERQRRGGSKVAIVSSVWPVENVDEVDRSNGFVMDSAQLLRLHKSARSRGEEVVGYYHSHPESRAVPSDRDRVAAGPGISYLIVGMADQAVQEYRSWRLRDDASGFDEEPMI